MRHCGEGVDSAPHEVGGEEHLSPEGGLKAAHDATPRHQPGGIGMDWASLDDDAWDDDFQTPHTPVHHIVQRKGDGCRELVEGRMESSRGSPGWQTGYQVDIGEQEAMLETIDPTWRTTHWLQLAVQGISDDEVPWYEFIIPLMVGTEGMALSLAKHLLVVWQWSIKVQGWDVCPPALTALNIGQSMTREEGLEGVDDPLWFAAYSCTLQQVGEVMHDGSGSGQWGRRLK